MSCYYTIVKREVICVNEDVKSDMWERKKGPLRRAQSTTHAQYQNRKKDVKKGESNLQPWDLEKREARSNVNSMC